MQFSTSNFFALLATTFWATAAVRAFEITAWSGAACSGIEVGFIEGPDNLNGLSAAEETPNGSCVTFDQALPGNCDLYLCADAACNDQGVTIEGPRDAGTREPDQSFAGIQVGCQ